MIIYLRESLPFLSFYLLIYINVTNIEILFYLSMFMALWIVPIFKLMEKYALISVIKNYRLFYFLF